MLKWLLGSSISVFVITLVVVVLWFKYPNARRAINTIVICVFSVALIAGTAYCINQLNIYYNAKGGVYGYISSLFGGNTATSETKDGILEVAISNIEFRDTGGDVFKISVSADKLELERDQYYSLFVNGAPASTNNFSYASKHLSSTYAYNFYNSGSELLCNDTLQIDVAFYDEYTEFVVQTNNKDATRYWTTLFNKQNFNLQVRPWGHKADQDWNYGEGEVEKFCEVKYMFNGQEIERTKYQSGQTITLPNLIGVKSLKFNNETLANDFKVEQDMVVEVEFAKLKDLANKDGVGFVNGNKGCIIYAPAKSTNQGMLFYDKNSGEYSIMSTMGKGWSDSSSFANGVYELVGDGTVSSFIYAEDLKIKAELDSMIGLHTCFADDSTFRMVYVNKSSEGIYLKDFVRDSERTLYATEVWRNFELSFNTYTGFNSKFTAQSMNHTLTYDFMNDVLNVN